MKRSTGIPRSLQTKVEKPESLALDGSNEDLKNTGVMVNADGDFVIAKPDKAAWELYQEKAKASAAAAAEASAAEYSRELQARGLECPIDKRMFLEPTKTPCCQRTYCNDCITNALIESDFICPGCGNEGVLLDNLSVDETAVQKIKEYEAQMTDVKKEKEKHQNQDSQTPTKESETDGKASPVKSPTRAGQPTPVSPGDSKKRPAENEPTRISTEPGSPNVPSSKKLKPSGGPNSMDQSVLETKSAPSGYPPSTFNQQVPPFCGPGLLQPPNMPAMCFPDSGYMNEGMGFMNSMMLPANGLQPNMGPMWSQMNAMNFNPQQNGMYGGSVSGAGFMPNGYHTPNMYGNVGEVPMPMFPMGQMTGPMQPNPSFQGPRAGHFSNQQRTTFSTPFAREEDSAYFRQPVNPQRHQARHRRIRPSDYREL